MKPPLCPLLVSTIATCTGIALYLGYLELRRFTGGKLIKLEELNQQLADKLNEWHPLPERWRIAGRIAIFIAILTSAVAFIFCVEHIQETASKLKVSLIAAVCVAFAYYAIELATTQITLVGNARILCVFIPVFRTLSWLLYPIAILIEKLKKHARERDEQAEIKSVSTAEDEIMSLINRIDDQYPDNPENIELQADERRMIAGALKLDDKTVHEIMTPRVDIDAVQKNAPMDELIQVIIQSGHSRIPIYDENIDQIIGVIFAKDLLDKSRVNNNTPIEELIRPPIFTPESKNIGDLLEDFQKSKTHFAIVIDEYGGTSGIITFEDILEEIVGEILDEYDLNEVIEDELTADDQGWYTLDARTLITDANKELELKLPDDDDFDTIGGYLAAQTGKILQVGEILTTDNIIAEIIEATPRCVKKIKIKRNEQVNAEE